MWVIEDEKKKNVRVYKGSRGEISSVKKSQVIFKYFIICYVVWNCASFEFRKLVHEFECRMQIDPQ